ncbi:MAG TPA: hypothetical protein PKA27_13130 [Fimbriimonadaceae bacterium]|nr:hypothetical protein [Fimbriimonadaceae bacterium]
MSVFKFSRPKGPGFGISANSYMTVMSAVATLPTLRMVISPKGENGSIPGFGVPLNPGAVKSELDRPMMRGQYGLASPDRKTVLRLRVLSKEEAGFDPGPFLRSSHAAEVDDETKSRMSATWSLLQLTFETHDPEVYPSLWFLLAICRRLGELTQGVVADPIAQRYLLPNKIVQLVPADPRIDARDHIAVKVKDTDGNKWVFTLGMQKFALPEMEIKDVPSGQVLDAQNLLISLAQQALLGKFVEVGAKVGFGNVLFDVAEGGLDRGQWEGIPCLELIPGRNRTVSECLNPTN